MMGIRTPAKKATPPKTQTRSPQNAAEEAGPSSSSVRRSVGEWEAGNQGQKGIVSEKAMPLKIRRASSETVSPPVSASRATEARSCITKIRLHLNNSKNLKKEIKDEVKTNAERLYALVKELDQEKGRALVATKPQRTATEVSNIPDPVQDTESLKKALLDHSRDLRENSEKLDRLKEALKVSQERMENFSYANVVASRPVKHTAKQTALHSIVVTSTKETETGEQVLDHIRSAVNAKEGWITVDKVRKARDRKVVLGCRTLEERDKVKEKLASVGELLRVEEVKNKDPLVVLKDVLNYNTNEDILKALKNQNKDLFEGLSKEEDRVEVQYRKKTRNPHTNHVVLRVSPKLWNELQERQTIHIDLQRIRVADQSPLVQCSMCLGYGHGRRLCKEQVEKCSHCGGPHMRTQCADWAARIAPSCCNCVAAKLENTEHNAFSESCPVRRRWEAMARARVAYC